jgi:hypothetical protein
MIVMCIIFVFAIAIERPALTHYMEAIRMKQAFMNHREGDE